MHVLFLSTVTSNRTFYFQVLQKCTFILHRIGIVGCDAKPRQTFTVMSLFFQLLQRHASADRMVVLLNTYEEEDEAYQNLVTVATTFFQYLLQPFRDMRELACLYKMEILVNAKLCVCACVWSTNRNGQVTDENLPFSSLTVVFSSNC